MNKNRPTIKLYYSSKINDINYLSDLFWGIEEEGIPYDIESIDEESAITSSYKAANDSRLDVGIGIDSNGLVVLHYVKLKSDKPLFEVNISKERDKLRALGANAARLVKGMPFKED